MPHHHCSLETIESSVKPHILWKIPWVYNNCLFITNKNTQGRSNRSSSFEDTNLIILTNDEKMHQKDSSDQISCINSLKSEFGLENRVQDQKLKT